MQEAEKIWMNGALVNWPDARVHVLSHGLHYGTTVFEGIRAYDAEGGTAVFRLDDHLARLERSAQMYHMPLPYTRAEIRHAVHQVVTANGLGGCYIRPIVLRGYGTMGLFPLEAPVDVAVAAWEWGAYLGEEGLRKGIRAKISSWRRIGSTTIPATAKAGGQYLNSILAKIESHKAGYQEAILLNESGYVADGSGENLFLVRDGALVTPPVHASILEGITRASIIALAGDEGIPVVEREVARGELYTADEVFITGTAAEVCPVNEIDDHELGSPGPDDAPAAGPLLRRHRGPRPALGRVAGLRRGAGGVAAGVSEMIAIYDTTLRDGMQREGLSLSVGEQLDVALRLADYGFDYLEAGFPASNPKYGELFRRLEGEDLGATRLAAFGMTRRRGVAASEDPAMRGLAECAAPVATLVGKTWDLHIEKVTRVSREENLRMIEESVAFLVAAGQGGRLRRRALLRRLRGPPGLRARLPQGGPGRRRRLDHALRHQRRHPAGAPRRRSSARSARPCPARRWASTPTTTPSARWPTASPPSTRARGWCRARSTATASAAATPT